MDWCSKRRIFAWFGECKAHIRIMYRIFANHIHNTTEFFTLRFEKLLALWHIVEHVFNRNLCPLISRAVLNFSFETAIFVWCPIPDKHTQSGNCLWLVFQLNVCLVTCMRMHLWPFSLWLLNVRCGLYLRVLPLEIRMWQSIVSLQIVSISMWWNVHKQSSNHPFECQFHYHESVEWNVITLQLLKCSVIYFVPEEVSGRHFSPWSVRWLNSHPNYEEIISFNSPTLIFYIPKPNTILCLTCFQSFL